MTSGATKRRAVVTGMGILSGYGTGLKAFEKGLYSKNTAIREIQGIETDHLNCHFGSEIPEFDPLQFVRKPELNLYDKASLLAMAGADEALKNAQLNPQEHAKNLGVSLGCAFGPSESIQQSVLREDKKQRLRPTTVVKMILNGPTAALCARYQAQKASRAHVTACAASAHAIGDALHAIERGEMDICLTGGVEAFPSTALFGAWDAMSIMSLDRDPKHGIMRPFSPDRSGFVIGEASAILVLEEEEHARARKAPILAQICGSGSVSDTPSLTKPTLDGMINAMQAAMTNADLAPEQIGYINTHGTATQLNDKLESDAIQEIFKEHASNITLSACKSAVGHCMGAGSALEAIATIIALNKGQAACAVPLISETTSAPIMQTQDMSADAALSNSFAFGGHYVSLAFKRCNRTYS